MLNDEEISNRFAARYRLQDLVSKAITAIMAPVMRKSISMEKIRSPNKILIANAGHLGDVIISTCVLAPLRKKFPGVEIGILLRTQCAHVFRDTALVERVHVLEHWAGSRRKSNRKIIDILIYYFFSVPKIVREIKEEKYDVSIDLHAWFPNYSCALYAARIPVRIGFDRLAAGIFLNAPVTFKYGRTSEAKTIASLLSVLGLSQEEISRAAPVLPLPYGSAARDRISSLLPLGRYHILHPASSTPIRDWPIAKWIALSNLLLDAQITPVITGNGSRDFGIASAIQGAVPAAINLVGKLSWGELAHALDGAELIYCVETSIGHFARALGKPVVALYGGMADPKRWAPEGATIITKNLDCVPCFNKLGCSHRSCLTDTSPMEVFKAGEAQL